jgi:hypothetical protein
MSFQITVLWVAVFIFLAILAFIGYNIYSSKYNTANWPPFVSDCPDYWSSDGTNCTSDGSYNLCSGTTSLTSFLIKDYPTLCDKFEFATKKCGSQFNWSGVSNSLSCN